MIFSMQTATGDDISVGIPFPLPASGDVIDLGQPDGRWFVLRVEHYVHDSAIGRRTKHVAIVEPEVP